MIWRTDAKLQTNAPLIDTALYNEAFTGRARAIPRCHFCLADSHESKDCSFAPEERPPTTRMASQPPFCGRTGVDSVEVCQLFNWSGGSQCRYKHSALHIYAPSAAWDLTQHRSVT